MFSSFELYFEDEEINCRNISLIRKSIRDSSNPLGLPNPLFTKIFRLNKESFNFLLKEIDGKVRPAMRSSSIPSALKLAVTLRFLGCGSYQQCVGNHFNLGLSQPTVSVIIKEMLDIFEEHICPKWINFELTEEEKRLAKISFFESSGFPGVVGCIDGTHIRIISPKVEEQHLHYNRKGFYSLNALIACDHKIRFIDARYPGAHYDSFIWNLSSFRQYLKDKYEGGEQNTWYLGDAGFPLKPFLITPFRAAIDGRQQRLFNEKHSKTRIIIEWTIRVLKNRFRCLLGARELHYSPTKATQITNMCCALHNICIYFNVGTETDQTEESLTEDEDELPEKENIQIEEAAAVIRNRILNSFL